MGVWSSVPHAVDHAAGSFDESVGRQFDAEQGGGIADADTWVDNEDQGPVGEGFDRLAKTFGSPFVEDEALDQVADGGLISVDPDQTTNPSGWLIATAGQTFDNDPGGGYTDPDTYDDEDPNNEPTPLAQIARFLQLLTNNIGTVATGIVALVTIYVLGNLFTFTFDVGGSDA